MGDSLHKLVSEQNAPEDLLQFAVPLPFVTNQLVKYREEFQQYYSEQSSNGTVAPA
jgi:hypothetical protein